MYQQWNENHVTPELRNVLDMGIPLFYDTWSTYIPEHKKSLCDKIVKRYYFNQIGCETPDRFVFYLNEHLERIMPYYNQLYASELIKIDPMLNHCITQNGRSIENLLKVMKTDSSSTGKVMRDFVNNSAGYTDNTAVSGIKSAENLDKIIKNVYNKDGTDDSITDTTENERYHEDKDTTTTEDKQRDINEVTKSDTTGNETGHKTEVVDGTLVTETDNSLTKDENQTSKDTDTGTIVDDGVGTSKSEGKKDWTETKDDDATTKVVTDLGETTNSDSRKDYADTPQINLGSSGGSSSGAGDDRLSIRTDYLTNVTWETAKVKHDLDSTVDTTFADDETKTHTETTSDNTNTTDKNTKTTNMIKDGTVTKETSQTEDNTENQKTDSTTTTDHNVDTTENLNKTVTTDDDMHGTTVENQVTDGTKDTTAKNVYDDDWTEKGNSDTIEKYDLIGTKDTKARASGTETKEGREKESQHSGSARITGEDTTRTTDTGKTDITKGFMNITSSALLEAFRKTFLNIDNMIIDDLKDNFLSVF